MKLARLLSYRCLGLRVTRCTSPEITHADTPLRQSARSTAEGASGGARASACTHANTCVRTIHVGGKRFWQNESVHTSDFAQCEGGGDDDDGGAASSRSTRQSSVRNDLE